MTRQSTPRVRGVQIHGPYRIFHHVAASFVRSFVRAGPCNGTRYLVLQQCSGMHARMLLLTVSTIVCTSARIVLNNRKNSTVSWPARLANNNSNNTEYMHYRCCISMIYILSSLLQVTFGFLFPSLLHPFSTLLS